MSEPRTISIRKGMYADNRLLSALGRRTFVDSFGADNDPSDMALYLDRAFNPQTQASELADPLSRFLIAESCGEAVGYAHLVEMQAPACIDARRPIKLARLYALLDWIGRGVGAAMMHACIDEAKQRQCDGIWLGVWGRNTRAIQFYRKWEFGQVGTQDFVLGHDRQTDLVFWRRIDSAAI